MSHGRIRSVALGGDSGRRRAGALVMLSVLLAGGRGSAHAESPLETLRGMAVRYEAVRDYTAVLVLQERPDGSLSDRQDVQLKFARPFKISMRWVAGPGRGRQALYVEGENDSKLIAREGGFLGFKTWYLDPRGRLAMRGHRRPITETGIGFVIDRVLKLAEPLRESQPDAITDRGEDSVAGRPTRTIELRVPPGLDPMSATKIVLSVDSDLGLPIREEEFDQEDRVLETTTYTQLRLNGGWVPADFDPDNPALGLR